MLKNQTALLIFTRNVHEEASLKKLFGNNQAKNTRLIQDLNKKVNQIAKASNLPYFVVSGSKQIGVSFKERYENAITSIFNKGFDQVITIGNDSPELDVNSIREIKSHLETNDLVYGSTNKGGIYTFGITRKGIEKFDFSAMSWQTDSLSNEFDEIKKKQSNIICLAKVFTEFNTSADIRSFIYHLSKNKKDRLLYGYLLHFSFTPTIVRATTNENTESNFNFEITSRGPPKRIALQA